MAIKAPTTSTKPALYKMVSLPSYGTATGTKQSGETKVVQSSYKSFITSINKIGATINSTIIVNQQILKTLQEDLSIRSAEYEKMKSSFQKEKAGKDIDGTDEGGDKEPWWQKAVGGLAKAVVPSFFEGLAKLGEFFLRAFVVQGVLRWLSNPENGKKLANIVSGLVKIFSWMYKFVTENLFKTIEGLVDLFDSDKNLWERIVGFGKFITGFGSLLLGMAFLKKPAMVIRGFTWVLTTLYKSLFKTKAKLAKQAGSSTVSGASSARGGGRGRGLATFAAGAAAGAVLSGMMGGGDSAPEQSDGSAPSAPNEPLLAAGGIATKPTSAILGERGPELTMPLSRNMPIPADNNKRRKDAGIKPLSSLGSFAGGAGGADTQQANSLSKLFMAPFKGIGAGILANISQVVTSIGGSTARAITPILGNLLAPIANSFGVPSSVVKTIQGKIGQDSTQGPTNARGQKKNIDKVFGKSGSLPSEQEKKFKKKNDNSVLGLLTDILGASIVINNKLGGTKEETPPPAPTLPPPASSAPASGSSAQPSTGSAPAAAPTKQEPAKGSNKPENGGWITGPMSGYPVSLDGGQSVAFEGHGTEWVGFKNFSTGLSTDAFVVPFNTPATKSQPNLIDKRLKEASSAGYSIPKMARGGRTRPRPASSTSGEKPTEKGTDKKQGSGGLPAVVGAGKYLLSRGFTVAEHKNFTKNNWNKNGPNTGTGYNSTGTSRVGGHSTRSLHYKGLALDVTDWRGGDWAGRTKSLAEEMYKNRAQLKLTQIIHDPWGSWFAGGGKGGAIGGHDSHLHLGFASGPGAENLDIQGGDYTSPGDGGDGDGGGDAPEEKEKTPQEIIQESISKIKTSILQLSGASPTQDVAKATEKAKDEKDRAQQAANKRINNAAAQAMSNAKKTKPVNVKQAFAMEPIILPGPQKNLPIEAFNPSTSMIQYAWKVNL
jgi:hypothetical protein